VYELSRRVVAGGDRADDVAQESAKKKEPAMHCSVGFQAIVGAPLSAGGAGFAFTHAVQVNS